jgi:4-carboxymuconolactone decarboxylase
MPHDELERFEEVEMTYPTFYEEMRTRYPEVLTSYEAMGDAVASAGSLAKREQRLIKLALALGAGLEGAAHSHARRALEEGITKEELRQAVLLALTTLGFPAMMRGMSWWMISSDSPTAITLACEGVTASNRGTHGCSAKR